MAQICFEVGCRRGCHVNLQGPVKHIAAATAATMVQLPTPSLVPYALDCSALLKYAFSAPAP